MKSLLQRLKLSKIGKSKLAVSNVISTIILTGILLTILLASSFVSLNILNAQMVSTEFEQAKSNMLLLDTTIEDSSLRPGAGGYVQFNEREGGIGITTIPDPISLTVSAAGSTTQNATFSNLKQLIYTAGPQTSAAVDPVTGYTTLRGNPSTAYVSLREGLGFLRLQQENGAKIKLDYNRVRIVPSGLIDSEGTNLVQVTFIHLIQGSTSGSGTVTVTVQNTQTNSTVWSFDNPNIAITIQQGLEPPQQWPPATWTPPTGTTRTIVTFSEIQLTVSIR